jgi:hypothetical protein
MIFDELNNMNKLTLPVAKRAAFEKIKSWLREIELEVDEDYLDVNKPDYVHFLLKGSTVIMLSRRKLNEKGLGKHLIYHPHKSRILKLTDIINQTF